jgi:hypothetical protein
LFKIAIQGVYISICKCIITQIVSSSSFFFLPYPLFMVISTGLKIIYSFSYRKCINHIHLLNFLFLPSLSHMWPPLSVTCFS